MIIYPELIQSGQGPRLAFLEKADPKLISETLVAFANTEGGTLIIGLTTGGKYANVKLDNDTLQKALREAEDLCSPTVVTGNWEEMPLESPDEMADEEASPAPQKTDTPADKATDEKQSTGQAETAVKADSDDEQSQNQAKEKSDRTPRQIPLLLLDDDAHKPEDSVEDQAEQEAQEEAADEPSAPPARVVYALRIPRSVELHALSDGRVLIRSGAKNRPLGGQEILRLASTKTTGDYEIETVPGITTDDFSQKMIDEYLEKRAERTKRPYSGDLDELLREIGAVNSEGQPTINGVLLFCDYPQQWIPQSSVVFAKFIGKTPRGESGLAGYTRREELTGPLPRLIEGAWNLIWSEMAVSAVVKGLEREERYEYPQFAVREAIVNAICHRDYRLKGRRTEIRMYSDRLEVISPGGLPGFITVENIKDEHFSRNPRLVNGLFQWGYIEELGLGIDRMIEVMKQAGHQAPYFDARPYSFAVTLYNAREKPTPPDWAQNTNTNYRQARALQYINEKGSITNREYRQLCQGVSAETLRLDLVDMVDKGILVKVGSKKGTHYILK